LARRRCIISQTPISSAKQPIADINTITISIIRVSFFADGAFSPRPETISDATASARRDAQSETHTLFLIGDRS
jgi:hypothetical protein